MKPVKKQAAAGRPATGKAHNPAKMPVLFTSLFIVLIVALFLLTRMESNDGGSLNRVDELPSIADQPVLGSESAKVTMIEFGDFKCPACKQWSEQIYPMLKAQYIDTGKMKLIYVNTLFHGEESELAAIGAEAVWNRNKEAFWPFYKALFAAQPQANHDALWITEAKLAEVAGAAAPQIDLEQFKADVAARSTLPQVDIDNKLVEKYGISQTPTIMINGIIMDNPFDLQAIVDVIEQELGE